MLNQHFANRYVRVASIARSMRLVNLRVVASFAKTRISAAMSTSTEAVRTKVMKPEGTDAPKLKLYNSLTRQKEDFVPLHGRRVLWYSCGPTVYDASHMGHARSYITFDILRRVLSSYFNYDVVYVMNITDIDDKIIRRARRNHLMEEYTSKQHTLTDTLQHVRDALKPFREKAEAEQDPDKKAMLQNTLSRCQGALAEGESSLDPTSLLDVAKDPLADWLDAKYGSDVTDHSIFAKLTRRWEEEYHKDMDALNVLPADVLTRVSGYVNEVVAYVQRIIDNGYGYESNGSVYFDVAKFSSAPDHTYAKLVPEAVGDLQALAEGEGELSVSDDRLREKRSRNDFALWKASKPGEPAWPSPWGKGRPGWHIECSVMACDILGEQADIHTGGVDLKFPHHDNEIAQAEACYGHDHWMSYFLHSGHLTIEGCKMSKSLKNFITIKEALRQYSSRQLRLAFLLHAWNATLDYSEQTMREALHWEKMFNEFFLRVKDLLRKLPTGVDSYVKFEEREKQLLWKLQDSKTAVHEALCDSVDTVSAMKVMKELVGSCNVYLGEGVANVRLLELVALYLTDMMKVFGVVPDSTRLGFPTDQQTTDEEAIAVPFASLLADFREQVRKIALENKTTSLLQLCDVLRDNQLPELGVLLEDKEGQTVVKYVGKEAALRERDNARKLQEEKERAKLEQKRKAEAAKKAREEAAAIPPEDMFRNQTDKFSLFDEQGVPTHDAAGQPITDSQRKKLRKQWQAQEKKHKDYLTKRQ